MTAQDVRDCFQRKPVDLVYREICRAAAEGLWTVYAPNRWCSKDVVDTLVAGGFKLTRTVNPNGYDISWEE